MHEELSNRWGLLPFSVEDSIFQLFDSTHPLRFYIGKSIENHRVLMLVVGCCPPKVKSMRAIKIKSYSRDDKTWALVLTLESSVLEPMFSLLCADLINFSRNNFITEDEALVSVLRRLAYWRLLLERETLNLLSESEIRGLCGELLFLLRLFDKLGVNAALKSWVGPYDAPQDFQSDEYSWEIKTIRPSASKILISSEFQLQVSHSPIYLVVIVLIETMNLDEINSFSINSLVENIRSRLWQDVEVFDLFEKKLSQTGYSPRSEYDEFNYKVGDTFTYKVIEGFPCITSAKLASSISKVSYEIEISECKKYLINSSNDI